MSALKSNAAQDTCLSLAARAQTNGQIQLTLNGESGVGYTIEASSDLQHWAPVATNNDSSITRVFTLVAPDRVAFYRASRAPLPLFAYALATRYGIQCNGNGLLTDSYNSAVPSLSNSGQYESTKTSTNGNVASVDGPVNLGQHIIQGDLYLGPTATTSFSGGQITGTIHTDFNTCFPDMVLPTTVWMVAFKSTVNGNQVYDIRTSGDYSVLDSSDIIVEPGVAVRLKVAATSYLPSSIHVMATNGISGSLTIFHVAGSATLSNVILDSGRWRNFAYFGCTGVTSITLTGTNFAGTIYAPSAAITANGGGASFSYAGSCIAKSFTINGNSFSLHFDEDLLRAGPVR